MMSFVRLLLLVAAFAYGAMPLAGMAVVAMPLTPPMETGAASHGPAETAKSEATVTADMDCPHAASGPTLAQTDDKTVPTGKPSNATGHCAACLTLPAQAAFADSGKPPRAAEAPALLARLVSQTTAPLTPPPRA
jgi:hypothetical protein